ncbi:outer membrane beta-barrel protein [Montanilutibacter psychrotolerans]|nr:outer membrane beta-barrel protein [Lysobacter psychrotolerans]
MKKLLVLALSLAAAPFAASAGELSYTYIEAGYSESKAEDLTLDGFSVKGSLAFADNFYGAVNAHQNKYNGDNRVEPIELALGYNKTIGASKVDFVAEVGYLGFNSELGGEDFHNDGFRVGTGIRAAAGKHVELGAKVTYTEIENMDSLVGVNLNGQVKINKTWGVVAEYHFNEYNFLGTDVDTWNVGIRASF